MRTACPWPWKLHNNRLAQGGAVFGGGGKGGSGGTTYQTQSVSIPPEVRARYDAVNARAEQVAQQPFTPYEGQFVAPMNDTQMAGVNQIAQASGSYQPYYDAATQVLGQGSQQGLQQYGYAGQNIQNATGLAAPYLNWATQMGGQAYQNAQPYLDAWAQQTGYAQQAAQPYMGAAAGLAGAAYAAGQPYLDASTMQALSAQGQAQPYMNAASGYANMAYGNAQPYMDYARLAAAGANGASQPYYNMANQQVGNALQGSQPYYTNAMSQFMGAQNAANPYMGAVNDQLIAAMQAASPYNSAAGMAYGAARTAGQPNIDAANQALLQGRNASDPYYSAARAGLGMAQQAGSPYLTGATEAINAAQNAGAPYLGAAAGAAQQGSQAVNPNGLQTSAYMDPYLQSVLDPTMASLRQQQEAEQSQLRGSQMMRGAYGGDRGMIGAANLARQQDLASAQVEGSLRSQAYQQALAAAQQQQGVYLGADQANRAALQNYANQALQIGQQGYQQGAQTAQTLQNIGQQAFNQPMAISQANQALGQLAFQQPMAWAGAQQGLGAASQQQQLNAGQAFQNLGQQLYQQPMGQAQQYAQQAQQAFNQPMATGQAMQGLGNAAFQNPLAASQAYSGLGGAMFQQPMTQAQFMGQLGQQAFNQPMAASQQFGQLGQQMFNQPMATSQQLGQIGQQAFNQPMAASQQYGQLGQQQFNMPMSAGQQYGAMGQQAFNQPMAYSQLLGSLGQQGYSQLLGAAQAQQGLGQGYMGYGSNTAGALQNLGQGGQQAGLAGGQALLGAGTLGQQTQQQLNAAYYNQFLQQQGYPFQVAQFLANIALGTGPLYGSTTTGVTGQPTPFFSDERVKKNVREIGETHDGQPLYSFDYKGEPDGQSHIGLMAQDVEKRDPGAVTETAGGIKAVDYGRALKHAAGGGPVGVPGISPDADNAVKALMPKGLAPPMRSGFAPGGTPGVDDFTNQLLMQIANPMAGTLPHGSFGKLPGKQGSWSPGLAAAKRTSPLGADTRMQAPQQPQSTGLGQAINTVKGGVDMYNTGEKIYDKASDWLKKQRDTQPSGKPADGSTTGGNQIKTEQLPPPAEPAAPPKVAEAPTGLGGGDIKAAETTGLAPETLVGSLDDFKPEDFADAFAARGGRIGRDGGGRLKTDLPFAEAQGEYVPEGLTDDEPTGKLDAPKLDMKPPQQQKDNTVNDVMSALKTGASIGMMFLARGGAADIEHAKKMIANVESGGNYHILGPHVPGQGRAHGKYQVMPANIPMWTEEALGRRMTPAEFLASPEAQERVFEHRFGKYLAEHGNLADAASMWHSGRPLAKARADGARDVNMSTEDYVRKVLGGAPPAEAHMVETRPRSAGLAPSIHDMVDDRPMPLAVAADTNDDFEMPDRFDRFASGGLVPRRGYERGGGPFDFLPPSPDTLDLETAAELAREIESRKPAASAASARSAARGDDMSPFQMPPTQPSTGVAPPMPPPQNVQTTPGGNPPPVGVGAGFSASSVPAQAPGGLPQMPASAADASTGTSEEPGFFGKKGWLDRNQDWLLAGVGGIGKMLASRSPFLGNAIGEGLAEGASLYPALQFKKQGLDIQQQQADTSSMAELMRSYQYMQRIADVERASNNGQVSAATASNLAAIQQKIMEKAGITSGTAQGQAPATGQAPAAGAQPRVGTPVSGGAGAPTGTGAAPAYPNTPRTPITANYGMTEDGVEVDKMSNPAYLRAMADSMVTPEEKQRYLDRAYAVENTGQVRDINGDWKIAKGWPEMQRQKVAVGSNQQWQLKEASASNERGNLLRTYGILEKTMQTLDTNPLAPVNAQIKENLRAIGFSVPDGANSAAAVQEITKQVAARAAAAGSDLGRSLTQEGSIEAIKSPEANKTILAQLYADLNAAESRYRFIDDKIREKSTGDLSLWQREWADKNPPQRFLDDAYNKLAVVGATPINDSGTPDLTRMKVGATYILTPAQYEKATGQKVSRNVRVKIGEENGQKGYLIQ